MCSGINIAINNWKFTVIGWLESKTPCVRGSRATSQYLKTQRSTGHNSGKRNTQMYRFLPVQLHRHVQLSPYLKHLHLLVHALVHSHLVNSQQFSAIQVEVVSRRLSTFILFHPSPVGRAWHLWMSLQCLSTQLHQSVHNRSGSMSVSLASIMRNLCPCSTACWAWRKILVSASSWQHGATASMFAAWLLTASSPFITMTKMT